MVDTIALEIIVWIFFFFAIAICRKANKDGVEWLKLISGVIAVLLALVGLIGLLFDLSPYI